MPQIQGPPPDALGQISANVLGAGPAVVGALTESSLDAGPAAQGFIAGRDHIFHQTAGVFGQSGQAGVFGNSDAPGGTGVYGRGGGAGGFGLRAEIIGSGAAAVQGQVFGPGAALAGKFIGNVEVDGNLTMGGGGDVIFGDCAEEFELASPAGTIEPGSVMVLDAAGGIHPCTRAYDKRAIGVVSGAGPYRPAIVFDRVQTATNRAPIALIGKVCCKVDARYGAIEVGDLLTTSPTPGHAMKAADPIAAFGTVVGKALRDLREGQDLIPILIALQ